MRFLAMLLIFVIHPGMNRAARMLLVDDDPLVLRTLAGVLRTEGFFIWEAAKGQDALRLARQHRPDLVLLDVRLPDVSGIQVCRQIKADAALPKVFVALFSGQATSGQDQLQGAETGADDYILKPIGAEQLLARIRMLLRLRDTTVGLRAKEEHYRR